MHLYLTMLLQVQVADQFSLPFSTMSLLVLGHPLVPPLLLLILPVTWFLQTLSLLPALYLRQLLPRLLPLVVNLFVYPLHQDTFVTPTSPTSPPLLSHHPMVLRSRQPKTANMVSSATADTAATRYCSLLPLNLLPFLMQINMLLGMMLCVMRSRLCNPITLGP